MTEEEKWFSGLAKNLRIDSRPSLQHRERLKGEMLDAFGGRSRSTGIWGFIVRWGIRKKITRYAAAAALILGSGVLMHRLIPVDKPNPALPQGNAKNEPAAMLTLNSLRLAFFMGDLANVEKQYDAFFGDWDPGQPRLDLLN